MKAGLDIRSVSHFFFSIPSVTPFFPVTIEMWNSLPNAVVGHKTSVDFEDALETFLCSDWYEQLLVDIYLYNHCSLLFFWCWFSNVLVNVTFMHKCYIV